MLSSILPIEINNSGNMALLIDFNMDYRNAPPNDYGFTIIYVKANISVSRNGRNIFTYEAKEAKGVGLNWSQANSKALDDFFELLHLDSDFSMGILNSFS